MTVLDELESLIRGNFPNLKDVAACFAKLDVPSTSIAILDDGVLSAKCYSTVGHDADTAFQACSISKPINALAVMRLVEQGKLALSNTLDQVLPAEYLDILIQGSPANQEALVRGITVKQLMSHTSGLSVHGYLGYEDSTSEIPMRRILAGELPANSQRIRLEALPGHGMSYSGGGIVVLQLILEAVTGQKYAEVMRELVLEPLGMTRSFYAPLPTDEKNAAVAHRTATAPWPVDNYYQPELAAAGLWTTPTDLLRAMQAVQKSLSGDGGFLRTETARELVTVVDGGMALSWGVGGENQGVVSHSGANIGFQTVMAGFIQPLDGGERDGPLNTAIAIMTNSEPGSGLIAKLLRAVAGLRGWSWPSNKNGLTGDAVTFWRPNPQSEDDWKAWRGRWTDEKQSHLYVVGARSETGELAVAYDALGEVRLLPAANSRRREDGGYMDFLLEGLNMMMSLEEDAGAKSIKLHRLGAEPSVLKWQDDPLPAQ